MTTAPQRPTFVLLWIAAFTFFVALAFGYLVPADARVSEVKEPGSLADTDPGESQDAFPLRAAELSDSGNSAQAAESPATDVAYSGAPPSERLIMGFVSEDGLRACDHAEVILAPLEVTPETPARYASVLTDKNGFFRMDDLPSSVPVQGKATLVACHPNLKLRSLPKTVDLASLRERELTVRLQINSSRVQVETPQPQTDLTAGRRSPSLDTTLLSDAPPRGWSAQTPVEVSYEPESARGQDHPRGRCSLELQGPHRDGTWSLILTGSLVEDPEADEDETLVLPDDQPSPEEILDAAVDSLPPDIQERLRLGKQRVARLGDAEMSRGRKMSIVQDAWRTMRSKPGVVRLSQKLSPAQAAKAKRLLQAEVRRIIATRNAERRETE